MKQNFAVLGAGNGGQVISAYLKLCGKHVTLYDRFPQVLAPIRARGGIQLEGVSKTGFAKLDQICEDVAQAVDGAEIIFVVLPAFAHAYVAQELAGCLVDGQTVVVCPGATGGALEFRAIWDRAGCRSKVRLCETNSLFYAARAQDAVATISGVKDELSLAALPAQDTQAIIDDLSDVYPQLIPAANVLETSLNNMNTVVHPLPVLLNAGSIERGEKFRHYFDGITPAVGEVVEQMDRERVPGPRQYYGSWGAGLPPDRGGCAHGAGAHLRPRPGSRGAHPDHRFGDYADGCAGRPGFLEVRPDDGVTRNCRVGPGTAYGEAVKL